MSHHRTPFILAVAAWACSTQAAVAQQRPPVRPLGAVLSTSTEALAALSAVRALPGGRLLVNDPVRRRVLVMDSTMSVVGIAADSTPSTQNAYGPRAGGLIPYRGDSTLFVDPASLSMLVIDPAGRIARIMAAPRPNDVGFLTGGPLGNPGFDSRGRLVYRVIERPRGMGMMMGAGGDGAPPKMPEMPDSTPLIRYDLATRTLDTAAFIKVPKTRLNVTQGDHGISVTSTINPMNVVDDWAVLPDGSIALVRGRDYHVDYVAVDGTRRTAEKIPFDWQRLTDEMKVSIIDSARTAMEKTRASMAAGGAPAAAAAAGIGGGDGPRMMTVTMEAGGGRGARENVTVGGPPAGTQLPPLNFVPSSELPDYRPAFASGSVRADSEGRLWVRTIPVKPLTGGPEYDVIDRSGKLVDRVMIPKGATIVGFGASDIVYLGVRDASGVRVVRARAR